MPNFWYMLEAYCRNGYKRGNEHEEEFYDWETFNDFKSLEAAQYGMNEFNIDYYPNYAIKKLRILKLTEEVVVEKEVG